MMQACGALATISKRPKPNIPVPAVPTPPDDADELFGKMISRLVKEIHNQMNKEIAKIECQQILLRYRFQTSQHSATQPQQYNQVQNNFSPPAPLSTQPQQYSQLQSNCTSPSPSTTPVHSKRYAHQTYSYPTRQPSNDNFCYNTPLSSPLYQYQVDGAYRNDFTPSTRYANQTPQEAAGDQSSEHFVNITDNVDA